MVPSHANTQTNGQPAGSGMKNLLAKPLRDLLDQPLRDIAQVVADAVNDRINRDTSSINPRLLTVAQAAVYLGRTEKAIRHLVATEAVPTVRSDGRVMLDVQDLDAWIRANKL